MSFSAQIKSTSPNQKKPADSENPTKLSLSQKNNKVLNTGFSSVGEKSVCFSFLPRSPILWRVVVVFFYYVL